MAFEAFIPSVVPLTGDNAIREGLSWRRTFVVTKTVAGAVTPVNMSEYDAAPPSIIFKTAVTESSPAGTTNGCPVGVCAWTSAVDGAFQIDVTAAASNPGPSPAQVFSGEYEIVVTHDTETDSTGPTVLKKTSVFASTWVVTKTVVPS